MKDLVRKRIWMRRRAKVISSENISENKNLHEKSKKKKTIPAAIKKLVWNTYIGEDIGKAKCICCKTTDITQMSFNCGHIIAEANGGELIVSNLKPICQNCNSSMGTKNMNDFMKGFKQKKDLVKGRISSLEERVKEKEKQSKMLSQEKFEKKKLKRQVVKNIMICQKILLKDQIELRKRWIVMILQNKKVHIYIFLI